jgi:hypothetical protein
VFIVRRYLAIGNAKPKGKFHRENGTRYLGNAVARMSFAAFEQEAKILARLAAAVRYSLGSLSGI